MGDLFYLYHIDYICYFIGILYPADTQNLFFLVSSPYLIPDCAKVTAQIRKDIWNIRLNIF